MPFTPRTPTVANVSPAAAITVAAPSGLANGDILLYAIYKENTAAVTWPSGFTQVAARTSSDSSYQVLVAWKRASGESGSYTASWTGNTYADAMMLAWSGGIASGSAMDATPTTSANGSQANQITVPSITTATANALLVAVGADFDVLTKTAPSGFALRGSQATIAAADQTQASAGASGSKAFGTNGTSQTVGIMLALAPAAAGSPPAAPTGLSATPASATQINLAWTDNATDETAYTVERSAAGAGSWSVLTSSLAAGTTSYNDTTASANTAYDYRVQATNGSGSSSYATASGARTYPGAPTGLGATAAGSTQINLSWTAPSGGATSYKIERSPTGSGSWTEIATGVTGTTYSSTGLTASTTYYYRVRSTNATGDSAYSSNANATTTSGGTVPNQVTGLSATPASSSQINLTWSAPSGATSYKVERSLAGAGSWTQIASGHTSTSYSATGLSASTAYDFRVRATNATGDGDYSSIASATTSGTAPAAPTGVTASAGGQSDRITVSWTAPSGADSQRVERSPNGSTGWTNVSGSLAGGATSYLNTGLSASTTYYYRVIATNASGDSSPSSTASATTAAAGAWRSTDVYREALDRYQPVLITSTAGVGYLAVCVDATPTGSSSWRWFSGPLAGDGVTLTEVANQAAAQTAALSLPTAAGGRWDLPALIEARTVRLWSRDALTLREFYAERVVEGDLIRAGSVKTLHLAAQSVTVDKMLVANLAAISANLGTVTAGTLVGLLIKTAVSGARLEMSAADLRSIDAGGVTRVLVSPDGLKTYNASGIVQVEATTATNGALRAGAGKVTLDSSGFSFDGSDGNADEAAVTWKSSGSAIARIRGGSFADGNDIVLEALYQASNGANIYLRAGAFDQAPVGLSIINDPSLRRIDLWTNLELTTAYLRIDPSVLTIANAGLNVGATSGAGVGQVRVAGSISAMGSANDRRIALAYDSTNDRGQIFAVQDNVAWKTLHIQPVDGGLMLGNAWGGVGFHGVTPGPRYGITGSRGGNAALASLLNALAAIGLITNSTSA